MKGAKRQQLVFQLEMSQAEFAALMALMKEFLTATYDSRLSEDEEQIINQMYLYLNSDV
jgi:hypothetical protein